MARSAMSSTSDLTGVQGKKPLIAILFSGKRKCGKDFISDLLLERIGNDKAVIIRISSPIKSYWAKKNGLNLEQLMSSDQYKERFREDMIKWSEAERDKDSGYFCRKAVDIPTAEKPVWIISDIRRRTDIAWFRQEYGGAVRTVRVTADDEIRVKRGFVYTLGVDDKATECDLDTVSDWDWTICNNGNGDQLEESLIPILNEVQTALKSSVQCE